MRHGYPVTSLMAGQTKGGSTLPFVANSARDGSSRGHGLSTENAPTPSRPSSTLTERDARRPSSRPSSPDRSARGPLFTPERVDGLVQVRHQRGRRALLDGLWAWAGVEAKATLEELMALVDAPAGETFSDLVPAGAGCEIAGPRSGRSGWCSCSPSRRTWSGAAPRRAGSTTGARRSRPSGLALCAAT